ncbi:MAG: hypothetical protein WHS88_11085 [Anaerohalosphaeraceae bacterium]
MDTRRKKTANRRRGSALILVVVAAVLLSLVGIMFLMISRVGDILGTAARQEHQMDQAVRMVLDKIELVLLQDLFGTNLTSGLCDGKGLTNEPYDAPGAADPWLAALEPVRISDNGTPDDPTDDLYRWPYLSSLWPAPPNVWDRILREGTGQLDPQNNPQFWGAIVPDYPNLTNVFWAPADADGDGVADSLWVPALETPTGERIYAAVRIIDNCGMLNLNTAHLTRKASPWTGQGRWLSEVDYEPFLRGDDRATPPVVRQARMTNPSVIVTAENYHKEAILNIENPGSAYTLFDINDELEMRNRFLMTSRAVARFEREMNLSAMPPVFGMYQTFDFGRGEFVGGWNVALRVKRIPVESAEDFRVWKLRMNPENFDDTGPWTANPHNYSYYYDRRHVCTFISFDRNLRWGGEPYFADWSESEKRYLGRIYRAVLMPADGHAVSVRADILSNTLQARRNILHLLYAFRGYYLHQGESLRTAARKAAQIVANMIDYLDDGTANTDGPFGTAWTDPDTFAVTPAQVNSNPTFINRAIIKRLILEVSTELNRQDSSIPVVNIDAVADGRRIFEKLDFGLSETDVIYGFERQPFVSELYVVRDNNNNPTEAALELLNPYDSSISLNSWRIVFRQRVGVPVEFTIPDTPSGTIPAGTPNSPGRFVIRSTNASPADVVFANFGMGMMLTDANSIDVQRPCPDNPARFITVDRIPRAQIELVLTDDPSDGQPTIHVLKRQDTGWKFTNASAAVHQRAVPPSPSPATLGAANGVTVDKDGWQMPVADFPSVSAERRFFTLGDFQKVLFVGNERGEDPNTVTTAVAQASSEGDIRFDVMKDPDLLGFICFLNREKGSLPGRININTAPKPVLAAAIPGILTHSSGTVNLVDPNPATSQVAEDYADLIIQNRPYAHLGELLAKIPALRVYAQQEGLDVVGDRTIRGDLEERDLILSHLSNIFTTRSDVFTAYILVRIGQSGPQRRVLAIFDRSQVWAPGDRPRLLAVKTVPNPR